MDELLGRRVHYNQQAEQSVIGSMLIDPVCIPDVLKDTKSEYFYLEANRDIFDTISVMFNFGLTIDFVTIEEEMKKRGVYRETVTKNYMVELMRITPTAANVADYIKIIRDNHLMRELGDAAAEITKMVNEGGGEADMMLENAERIIYALRNGRGVGGLKPISEVVREVYDEISSKDDGHTYLPGVSTGLTDLDNKILGLNKGELVLIAARPGMGKTSLALNIALSAAKASGKAVALFSLEMSREQLVTRILSSESHVDSQKLLRGGLNADDWQKIVLAAGSISSTNMYIDDNSTLSVSDMNAQCRRVKDLGLVVIDYLQLMQSAGEKKGSENRVQVVSDISRMMKIMAKDLEVPVICLSQLNRAAEGRTDKRPVLSDLRESGSIEQDADVVIGIYREGYYNKECQDPNEAEAIILKNRKGETGTVYLRWLPEYTAFASAERRRSEDDYY